MKKFLFIALILFIGSFIASAQTGKLEHYQLPNGLTVILYSTPQASNVFGMVGVKAGSYHEPKETTGLAHYLEHVLFKGTEDLGTTNWELEKPYYDKIIDLFEQKRSTTDATEKKNINKEINDQSIKAGQYAITNEIPNLVQSIGGTDMNANTSTDRTCFFNSFPSFQMERWLNLYAHRFIHPVFRGFQTELETVYEEKNMYSDDPFNVMEESFEHAYYGSDFPYGRPVVGTTYDLKNPSLKALIKFYDEHYVPGNMVLILCGNFNVETTKPLIEKTFGAWESKPVPSDAKFTVPTIVGKQKTTVRLTPLPIGMWTFPAVPARNKDELGIEMMTKILNNTNQTGLADQLVLDGDINQVQVSYNAAKYDGYIQVLCVPTFDMAQMRFNSLSSTEKLLTEAINKLKKGDFDPWLLAAVKTKMQQDYDRNIENPEKVGNLFLELFVNNENLNEFNTYKEKIQSITKDDIVKIANKYFGKNYLAFYSLEGQGAKDKIEKPKLDPIKPAQGAESKFATYLKTIPIAENKESFINFRSAVGQTLLAKGVHFYYTPNPENDVFTMTIKFGAGSHTIPAIDMATSLMNSAGILGQYKANEVKEAFSKLGCTYHFSSSDSYTYITLSGDEKNLEEACKLLTKLYLMPALDEKQMDKLLSSEIGERTILKKSKPAQVDALKDYLFYGKESPYINRVSDDDVKAFTVSSLAAEFIKATQYETSVHYVGKTPFAETLGRLQSSLSFPSGLSSSSSPYVRPFTSDPNKTIYFINNNEATQSSIYLFVKSDDYTISQDPYINAFNQYFSGGFNGIVIQEIRELRSYAYTAGARYLSQVKNSVPTALIGMLGTQADKTTDATAEFIKLLQDMPEKPERLGDLKQYLVQAALSTKPSFRDLSVYIENMKKLGYKEDPAEINIPIYKAMKFDDITNFYKTHIQGKPYAIAIVGNRKKIDMDALKKLGTVKTLDVDQIFGK